MKFIGIIPARYASTRFPGKPLAMLGGRTVIQRVYEQAAAVLEEAYVATDDERIFKAVEEFGGRVIMTRQDHKSGTDRIEEAAEKIGTQADVIINIQGDEPFIQKSQIETLKSLFENSETQIGTLGKKFESIEAATNPNSPKIVTDKNGFALYFSRTVSVGDGRKSGTVAMAGKRLPHSRRTDRYGNGGYRHPRRPASCRGIPKNAVRASPAAFLVTTGADVQTT